MKTKHIKNRTQFNININEEEYTLIKNLRETYAINISGAFKVFLKELQGKMVKK